MFLLLEFWFEMANYTPKNILITGAAGFIASHVANRLVRSYPEYKIVVLDKLDYCSNLKNLNPSRTAPNFKFVKGDIGSADLVNYLLITESIDTIMHFAAQTHVDNSFGNSLEEILRVKHDSKTSKIWRLVVAAMLWTIWLCRNEFQFNRKKLSQESIQDLIFARVNKWGHTSGLIPFSGDPLWHAKSDSMIAIFWYKNSLDFWIFRISEDEKFCLVDGICTMNQRGHFSGGIGVLVKSGKRKILHSFSASILVKETLHAILEAILDFFRLVNNGWLLGEHLKLYTSSPEPIYHVSSGFKNYYSFTGSTKNLEKLSHFIHMTYIPV